MSDRNLLKGIFLIAIALSFGVGALRYSMGDFSQAGPGLFPLLVSSVLLLLGLATVIRSLVTEPVAIYFNTKNIGVILASLVGFALLSEYGNMILGSCFWCSARRSPAALIRWCATSRSQAH